MRFSPKMSLSYRQNVSKCNFIHRESVNTLPVQNVSVQFGRNPHIAKQLVTASCVVCEDTIPLKGKWAMESFKQFNTVGIDGIKPPRNHLETILSWSQVKDGERLE